MTKTIENLTSEQLMEYLSQYQYVLLYKTDSVKLMKAEAVTSDEWIGCIEARLFCQDQELHALLQDCVGVITDDSGFEKYVDQVYKLTERYAKSVDCKDMVVRQYLAYDEDGQAYVAKTRLVDVE